MSWKYMSGSVNSIVWTCVKLLLVGAVLTFGGVLYYYVSTKDTLEFRTGIVDLYLKFRISRFFSGADVDIRDVRLSWRKADENFFLSAKGITVVNKNLGFRMEIPEVLVYSKIGILFLWGDWGASRVEIPEISLNAFDSGEEAGVLWVPSSVPTLREKLSVLAGSSIPVKVGSMLFRNQVGEDFKADSLSFGTEKKYDGRVFSLELASGQSSVKVRLSEHYKGVLSLSVQYDNFDTRLLGYLKFLDSRLAAYNRMLLSGTIGLVLDAHDHIEYVEVNLQSLRGVLPYGGEDIVIQHLRARAKYSGDKLTLTGFDLLADDVALRMQAAFDADTGRLGVNIGGYEIEAQKVCKYWPEVLHPNLKSWYCGNVKGVFREPQVAFYGSVDDVKNVKNYRLSSHVKDATITVSDGVGSVNIVDGGLLIDKGELVIRSGNYNFRGINAVEGVATIRDSDSGAKLEVQGRALCDASKLYDAVNGEERFKLESQNVTGAGDTKFSVNVVDLFSHSNMKSDIHVKSEISNFAVRGVLGSFDVYDAGLEVVYQDGAVEARMNGKMNEHDMTLRVTGDPGSGGSMLCKFNGYVSGENIQKLSDIARGIALSGHAKANINWVSNYSGLGDAKVDGVLDTSGLHSSIGYFPTDDQERPFRFSAVVESDGDIQVNDAAVEGQDVKIQVRGSIGSGGMSLTADTVRFLKTDARASVESKDGDIVLRLSGKLLDLSKADFGAFLKGKSLKRDGAFRVDVRSKNTLLKNNVTLSKLLFSLDRDRTGNLKAQVSGRFSEDNALVSIEYGPRGLEVSTENAGSFLRAIDVLNTVDGGYLSIYMYPDNHRNKTHGMFSITNFNIVNAPILAQILTLSSLQGISNTLSGSGIHFGKLNVPFSYSSNLISFKESWIEGIELGISLGGEIDLNTKSFDVRGQIVPAYAVSKLVWNTPMVGKLLTGGQSRGIVAIDYKVKGTAKAHDISVNFLSILTPNLLKRVLQALDDKSKGSEGGGIQETRKRRRTVS
ncbi:MAG: AsmA-like C-terminal domain-containing protein [Anaplasma sp.]